MLIVFIHGAPNGPTIWNNLISRLGLHSDHYVKLALPGFSVPCPEGFHPHRDSYVKWLISEIESIVKRHRGPVHVVGHDFGAAFTLRLSSIRSDLILSWVVFNSLIDAELKPHRLAKFFKIPLISTLLARIATNKKRIAKGLERQGLSATAAQEEANGINKDMYQCVKMLYKSSFPPDERREWEDGLHNLPDKGLLIWGSEDPYVPLEAAKRFSKRWGYPLHIEMNAGHWPYIEKTDSVAKRLKMFWDLSD